MAFTSKENDVGIAASLSLVDIVNDSQQFWDLEDEFQGWLNNVIIDHR
jgi:hypothetical protein